MLTKYFAWLLSNGNGFLLNSVLVELMFTLLAILITVKVIKPVLKFYRNAKKLQNIATNPKPHWFYGHAKYVSMT